jgi:hypothetical protein
MIFFLISALKSRGLDFLRHDFINIVSLSTKVRKLKNLVPLLCVPVGQAKTRYLPHQTKPLFFLAYW